MQIHLTISDAIAKQAEQYGLFEQNIIEKLLKQELSKFQKRNSDAQWQETVQELAGAWQDFPDAEELRAGLMQQSNRESL